VKTRSWNLVILMGILLGASLAGIVALVLLRRRFKEEPALGLREVPWRDVMKLIGPIFALARQLLEMSRRQVSELDIL